MSTLIGSLAGVVTILVLIVYLFKRVSNAGKDKQKVKTLTDERKFYDRKSKENDEIKKQTKAQIDKVVDDLGDDPAAGDVIDRLHKQRKDFNSPP